MVTEVTVRPTTSLSRPEKPIFGVYTPGDTDNITAREVLSGLNPLHQIPFVSQLYESAQEGPSTPAVSVGKLIGGALIGGPIGFLVSLANVIFEQQTGETMVSAVANAITGNEPATQVASAAKTAPVETASLRGVDTPTQEILPPVSAASANDKIASAVAQDKAIGAQMQMATAMGALANPASQQDQDVLSLFGEQKSAHSSYRKAQMLPYLKDVTVSQVL